MVGPAQHQRYAALRTSFAVVALLGLFAMHGLTSHGTAHGDHAGEPIAVLTAVERAHAAHGTSDVTTGTSGTRGVSEVPDPDRSPLGLAGMCLAILLAGVIVALAARRSVLAGREHSGVRSAGRPARARRDRDPPCLFTLSIQRC